MRAFLACLAAMSICLFAAAGSNAAVLNGTSGMDCFDGTSSADTMNMYGGIDSAYGLGGNDTINGGGGNDQGDYCTVSTPGSGGITLWHHPPRLNGGNGNDYIYGGDGNDLIVAGDGDDEVYGNDGNDVIWASGDSISDRVYGNGGEDWCYVTLNDVISGCEHPIYD